ncbi:Ribosome production factor 1 [Malassezia caprae]|uniref:Ribosome production factor 1 n=1 Tax=Malassezia caprae TaxID=1381934 RepID=A0AAF0IVA6_9BASI|nr:Ribosome production factor 1 [Malassezia caprae]
MGAARADDAHEGDAGQRHTGSVAHIGNKHKRQDMYQKYRKEKAKRKLARRLKTAKDERAGKDGKALKKERLAKNKPRTIENTRVYNPTLLHAPNTHEMPSWIEEQRQARQETQDDEDDEEDDEEEGEEAPEAVEDEAEADEVVDPQQAKYDVDDDPSAAPAILITTSMPSNSTSPHLASANARSHPAEAVRDLVKDLLNVFPGAEYRPRAKARGAGLGKICGWARARRYDAFMVIGESNKKPCTMTLVALPLGPTALFRLTSVSLTKDIVGHARATPHTPELILNNFTTALGHRVGRLLQHLFPKIPQLEGRQVVTAHNQRDYVFFRRHRYEFRSTDKAALQEIGPRFTLKLHKLSAGLPKGAGAWDGRFVEELEEAPANEESEAPEAHAADEGVEFQWQPKMSVSRRQFYL